jgi:cytochrome b subunit of formate dehydrogenase
MIVVGFTTVAAALLSITGIFLPLALKPETAMQGTLDAALMALFLVGVVVVVCSSVHRCWATLHGAPLPEQSYGAEVKREREKVA